MTLLDDLRTKRATAHAATEEILTRSAESGEPLSTEDATEHARAVADATEAGDAIESYLADQLAELRAGAARRHVSGPTSDSPVLSREQSVDSWCRTRGLYTAEDADEASFDRRLRGITVGDWSGAAHERALNEGTATAGGHPTLAILDEFGVISRDVYEVVSLASGKRDTSLILGIGTPPADWSDSVLADMRGWAAEHPEDETFVWREYSAAGFEDHLVDCRHCWQLANPALGDFLSERIIASFLPPRPGRRRSAGPGCASSPRNWPTRGCRPVLGPAAPTPGRSRTTPKSSSPSTAASVRTRRRWSPPRSARCRTWTSRACGNRRRVARSTGCRSSTSRT